LLAPYLADRETRRGVHLGSPSHGWRDRRTPHSRCGSATGYAAAWPGVWRRC